MNFRRLHEHGYVKLDCNALKKGQGELRLVVLSCSGTDINERKYKANYTVGNDGTVVFDESKKK